MWWLWWLTKKLAETNKQQQCSEHKIQLDLRKPEVDYKLFWIPPPTSMSAIFEMSILYSSKEKTLNCS